MARRPNNGPSLTKGKIDSKIKQRRLTESEEEQRQKTRAAESALFEGVEARAKRAKAEFAESRAKELALTGRIVFRSSRRVEPDPTPEQLAREAQDDHEAAVARVLRPSNGPTLKRSRNSQRKSAR